ncbi:MULTISPECIES: DoxX family protein [Nocardia]|uniref:DoxX family protein n=1 Tax=Nocardia TaxID=1817 RepID=UPI00189328B1|nr:MULTISPECIES: DoxX family protein [Nocardia]MBF6351275.1 DoxX family protein [Nocardia flavorosea]
MSAIDTAVADHGVEPDPPVTEKAVAVRWPLIARVGFRFGVIYTVLFCVMIGQVVFALVAVLDEWLPDTAPMWPLQQAAPVLEWVGRTVFGIEAVFQPNSGSGDQAAIWVMLFCIAVVAAAVTLVWSVLDRRRPAYPRLAAWFLTGLRLCLAGQMLFYGIAKAIPSQMPPPSLTTLLQPYGQLTPMSVLWLQVGSSPVYEILLGVAELTGGLLLLLPRTATLGAMLSVVSMAQVFVLNMTFDVPVKILSFHLLVFSLVLLAPQARRFADFFLLARRAEPAVQPPLFTTARANRYATWAQAAFGVWLIAGTTWIGWASWQEFGGGAPKPELYGMWEVTEFRVDGEPVPPLLTDETRWQRLVIEFEGAVTVQGMDGRLMVVPAESDPAAHTLAVVTDPGTEEPPATFSYTRPTPEHLQLEGELDGRPTRIELSAVDPGAFPLNGDGFHWVQDYPSAG